MTANKEMVSSFLTNSRSTSLSADKRTRTITWDFTPGKVFYNYVIPGGSTQRKGYYNHQGIYRYENGAYKANNPIARRGLFEGVKCVKIQYRKNSGTWTTISDVKGIASSKLKQTFTSSKNGDVYEVKATYQVWTMGSPFRLVPFMWFGTLSGVYNDGANKFSQSTPANPGRGWSGMCNYEKNANGGTDKNSSWKVVNYSWYQPNSTSKTTNWTYLHAKDYYESKKTSSNGWLSNYACEKWLKGMPYSSASDGWTGNVTGVAPQKTRKSSWWTFEKTFTDKFTVSGVTTKPSALSSPTVTLKVINNLTNKDSAGRLNGIAGTVQITYKQSNGVAGTYKLWAYQQNGTSLVSALVKSESIKNNETKTLTVNFTQFSTLKRSKNIAYYVTVETPDPEYNTTRTGKSASSITWTNLIAAGTHYYNDEPLYSTSFTSTKTEGSMQLKWNACTDPDKHPITYTIYVHNNSSTGASTATSKTLRIKSGSSYITKTIKYNKSYTTTNTSYTISTTGYSDGANLDIYMMPSDSYYNDYYYANSLNEVTGPNSEVVLKVIDNMTVKDSSGILSGDHGTIQYTYTHRNGLAASIKFYAYIASSTFSKTSSGSFACQVYSLTNVASGKSGSFVVNFNSFPSFKRGYYIKYFAVATDTAGKTSLLPYAYNSSNMWYEATGYHYFNSIPTAVSPFITEDQTNMYDDNYIDLAWAESIDLEDHTVFYKMYVQVEGNTPYSEVFYFNNVNNPSTQKYTKILDLGSSTLPTNYNPYSLKISDYIGKNISVWIKTYDSYNADKYLCGSILNLGNPAVGPDIPSIEISHAYAKDLYGEDKVDGENGYVSVSYSHPAGRPGSVYLHAICKNIVTGEMKAFNNIAEFQLNSGEWSPDTKLNFPQLFGNDWRSSEIRYYATAKSRIGEWSELAGQNWTLTTNMWDKCVGTHKFNEEPGDVTAWINHDKCNLHDNIFVEWTAANDPDDQLSPPAYTVVLAVKSDLRATLAFVQGSDKSNINRILPYTEMWDTVNTSVDIDIGAWDINSSTDPKRKDFAIYIIPHDDYANSYYYMAEVGENKVNYGRPKLTVDLKQDHSEHGEIIIKYEHEDLTANGDGTYTSNDPEHRLPERGDFDGLVSIYCFVDDEYSYNYTIQDIEFKPGQEKTINIDFENICPYSRSHEIRYYIVATDKLTEVRNHDEDPEDCTPNNLTVKMHYYNDEPFDPEVIVGPLLIQEDKQIYGFTYVDLVWETPYEPDGDDCMYYIYINTPASFGEQVLTTTIVNRDYEPVTIDYTRKYRVFETYDAQKNSYGCNIDYMISDNEFKRIQENTFLGIRMFYEQDHLGKVWPENEKYTVVVEARDLRGFENSYYGVSNVFTSFRKHHEPPFEVQLEVTHNLTNGVGDGERGTMNVTYTHPEGDVDATVTIHAYQDDVLICDIYTGDFHNNESRVIEYNFTNFPKLKRSKEITYYAVAVDKLVGLSSLDRIFTPKDSTTPPLSNDIKLQHIPYLVPFDDGTYGLYDINIDGVIYDYNDKNGNYVGPVQKGIHYYNEEPPSTTPVLYNEDLISYKSAEITWPHVVDPDGHDVSYEIYVAGTDADERMNTNSAEFYNDDLVNPNNTLLAEEAEIAGINTTVENTIVSASGWLKYHKMVSIPSSLAADAAEHFSLSTEEYSEDTTINIWIVSKDQYTNSYYRAGNILSLSKGHDAKDIREMYPRNGSTVYAQCPRILIYLGEDDQVQTTYVGWREKEYNNRDNPEMFSSLPNNKNVIIFKPPTPYTTLSGTKVSYYAYTHNQCSYSDKRYATYTYKDFFATFTEQKLIALKSDHINAFRKAINITRDAYGLPTVEYGRTIQKGMFFENYDFNETKNAICEVNDLLNNADSSDGLDYNNPLIVNIKDLDVVEYEGLIGTSSYNEFLEWARLVYILQNL